MNKKNFNWLTDKVMEIVDESDNRENLIEDITNFIDVVDHTIEECDEIEIIDELYELMENSDEYGFTELKIAVEDICEKYSCEEEEEEEEEPTNYGIGTYGYIDDSTTDGKARAEIVKLLIDNTRALMGNNKLLNRAIINRIREIINSLAIER